MTAPVKLSRTLTGSWQVHERATGVELGTVTMRGLA